MKKATDIILRLYKSEYITQDEVHILLDGIWDRNYLYNPPVLDPYKPSQAYKPEYKQWNITSNSDNTNVE